MRFIAVLALLLYAVVLVVILSLWGCAYKHSPKTMLCTPFTSAKFESGGEIDAKPFPSEVVLK